MLENMAIQEKGTIDVVKPLKDIQTCDLVHTSKTGLKISDRLLIEVSG